MRNQLIKTLNGMGTGLLATLVVGTILIQMGTLFNVSFLKQLGEFAKVLMAPAIGVGVGVALQVKPLILFSCLVTAAIGAGAIQSIEGQMVLSIGEPVGAYLTSLFTAYIGQRLIGKTKVDIILVPMSCLIVGGLIGIFFSPVMTQVTKMIGMFINEATQLQPLYMGAIISVVMCLVILSPISSAALAVALGLEGLAGGSAVVGCACSMVGFAVISYHENGIDGLLSQGIGTSKIQFGNAVKNPYIIIPTLVASFICGMLSTTFFKMECNRLGAGMGTSGLVGQIQTISVMGTQAIPSVIILHFILPALISLISVRILHKKGFIKLGDLKLSLG